MVSKITALYDWKFEEAHGVTQVNDFALMIAKKAVNSFVRTPFESIQDNLFLKELLDSLAMSGIANEIAGSSAPTSGSEHLISHALDKILEMPQLHGIQVGIATYLMSRVHDHRWQRINTVSPKPASGTMLLRFISTWRITSRQLTSPPPSNRSAIPISMKNRTANWRRKYSSKMKH